MNLDRKKLKKIKDDASFRCFYRKKSNKKNSIIVYANKEKEKNLLIYDAVNNLLIKKILPKAHIYYMNTVKNREHIKEAYFNYKIKDFS